MAETNGLLNRRTLNSVPRVRISSSPLDKHKALNINNLEPYSVEKRDRNGTLNNNNILSDINLYDILQDLSEKKKMQFFKPIPYCHYKTCTLSTGKDWFVSFYVLDPSNEKLKRIRIKINREKSFVKRKKIAALIMEAINQRLALGWNPLIEKKAPKAFSKLFEVFDIFLRVKKKESEENTFRCYNSYLKMFRLWLQEEGFTPESFSNSVTSEIAQQFMDDVENDERLSARTFNNYLSFFFSLFNWMKEKGYTTGNPFEHIKKKPKRLTKKTRRILTDEELSRLISFLAKDNHQYLAMALICYCCFVRPKEIVLLRCEDIDLEKQTIHIREEIAKNDNNSYRTIPDDLLPILRRIDLSKPKYYVFGKNNHYDFSPSPRKLCSRRIATYWEQVIRPKCGFGMDLQFYSLKDTGITNMVGVAPINLVQKQADHSSLAMTSIYLGQRSDANETLKKASILPKIDIK